MTTPDVSKRLLESRFSAEHKPHIEPERALTAALHEMPEYTHEWRYLQSLIEQLEAAQRKADAYDHARSVVKIEGNTRAEYVLRIEALQEQLEALRGLKVSADAALEAMGERLECVTAERNDLRERLEKLASWYGHDLEAAVGSNPAKERP